MIRVMIKSLTRDGIDKNQDIIVIILSQLWIELRYKDIGVVKSGKTKRTFGFKKYGVCLDKIKPKHQKRMEIQLERINPNVIVPKVYSR